MPLKKRARVREVQNPRPDCFLPPLQDERNKKKKHKNRNFSRAIPVFHSFYSLPHTHTHARAHTYTQSRDKMAPLSVSTPDSVFLQINGELIQILRTRRHSTALPRAPPRAKGDEPHTEISQIHCLLGGISIFWRD